MRLDLSDLTKQVGVSLEQKATAAFGQAVEDFSKGALQRSRTTPETARIIGTEQVQTPGDRRTWNATSYAAGLAGGTDYRPKLKFLFKVEFRFAPEILSDPRFRFLQNNTFTFTVKQVDRPKVDFEYEDDVNIYNYRTKVLKRIKHRELTLTFMDDVGNNVFDFFRALLAIYSPITSRAFSRDNNPTAYPQSGLLPTENSMDYSSSSSWGPFSSASHRSVVNSTAGTAINLIRIQQVFIDPSTPANQKDKAINSVYYDFINPRLVSFDLDDLNHEASEPNLLTMQFDYDWLEMTKNDGIEGNTVNHSIFVKSVAGQAASGVSPDLMFGRTQTSTNVFGRTGERGGGKGLIAGVLQSVAGRSVQKLSSSIINNAFQSIAGRGRFASSIGGRILTGAGGRLSSSVGDAVGGGIGGAVGIVSSAVSDQAAGLFSTVRQSVARNVAPIFADKATPSVDTAKSVARSSDAYVPQNSAQGSTFNFPPDGV